ncbi:NfuA family Fe-S biogenesis protein [Oleiagrimonas sp. C23AA]|uniref:NfuA family Fe-S biogenesis protein n=1 Tax=Oleiagrimonas sp. C23AA TaxID=2719047 RepID=UPI0014213040|nr:NfuA family Fe-S biogenesis protein [Oleiagrimonas sp. C23AA]NII09393.1 NfuA family Fe-S biogenesis protein [Oleiagrimonas sp. C23AA]
MIDISERAQNYFRHLLEQQGVEGQGIRLSVVQGGTPAANCALEFCEPSELDGREWTVECTGFNIYVDGDSVRWLDEASIDFEINATGGQLNIRAPKIKGEIPGEGASLVERVRYVIDAEINPQVASHGGRISLLEVSADGVVVLQFGGGCHGCGMVDVTLKQGVEKTLKTRVPEITEVRDATDHASGENPYYSGEQGASAVG